MFTAAFFASQPLNKYALKYSKWWRDVGRGLKYQTSHLIQNLVYIIACLPQEKQPISSSRYRVAIKGTVSRDFLLQVFIHESSSPKPPKIGSLRIFSNILGDIRKSRCFTPPVSTTPVANNGYKYRLPTLVNFSKTIYLYVTSATRRCPNKKI
jgi:hypothetical protein